MVTMTGTNLMANITLGVHLTVLLTVLLTVHFLVHILVDILVHAMVHTMVNSPVRSLANLITENNIFGVHQVRMRQVERAAILVILVTLVTFMIRVKTMMQARGIRMKTMRMAAMTTMRRIVLLWMAMKSLLLFLLRYSWKIRLLP